MAEFQYADIPNAFEAGRQIGRQRQQENALAKAAKSFGAGDYKSASNELFQYAPDMAMKTANYGQQQQQQQARMQAGTMAASGDLKGAASTLAGQGDLEGWKSLDDIQTQKLSGMYDFGARVLYGLQGLPVEQRKAAALAAARNSPYADILVPQTEQENDWSDGRLQAGIAGAISVQDQLKQKTEAAKLDQGERRLDILERGVIAKENNSGGAQFEVMTPEQVKQQGLTPGSYKRNIQTNEITPIGRQKAQYSEYAGKSANYANRMNDANKVITALETDPKVWEGAASIGALGLGGAKVQQARQAKRNFLTAVLRQESGAVIGPSEFDSADKQYFPQPNDGPEVIAQKRRNREQALLGMQRQAQGAYEEWFPDASGGGADLVYDPVSKKLVPAQ